MVDADGMKPCFAHVTAFTLRFQWCGKIPIFGRVELCSIRNLEMAEKTQIFVDIPIPLQMTLVR